MLSRSAHKDYPPRIGADEPSVAGTSLAFMLEMVGDRKSVLDVGCASGYFAKLLTGRRCDVIGIDENPAGVEAARAYCTRVIVADIDETPIDEIVGGETFDVVVFGDVLEHLGRPMVALESVRALLNDGGYVVASIPNIAHGAVRLALLNGQFNYQELGILDDTHLRFFTAQTVEELFLCSGFRIDRIERTVLPVFEPSNLLPLISRENYASDTIDSVLGDAESETLQFIVKAYPLADEARQRFVNKRYLEVSTQLSVTAARLASKTRYNDALGAELEDARRRLHEAESEARVGELEAARAQARLQSEFAERTAAVHSLDLARNDFGDLTTRYESLDKRCEMLGAQCEELRSQRDALAVQSDSFVKQRDNLAAQRDSLTTQRDNLNVQCNNLAAQREIVAAQRQGFAAQCQDLTMQRDSLIARCESLDMRCESLAAQCESLKTKCEGLASKLAEQTELVIERTHYEATQVAASIDSVQSGFVWRMKRLLVRPFGRHQ